MLVIFGFSENIIYWLWAGCCNVAIFCLSFFATRYLNNKRSLLKWMCEDYLLLFLIISIIRFVKNMCRLKCYTFPFSFGWGSRTFTAPAGELGNWTFPQQESNPWIYESPNVSWQMDLPPPGVQPLDIWVALGELGNWTFPHQESNPWIYESHKVS